MKPNYRAEQKITNKSLRDILIYCPDSGIFFMAKTRGGVTAGSKTGCLRKDGYIQVKVFGRWYLAHRLAWLWINKKWPPHGYDIDHINRDKSDNRISNLRLATRSQNCANGSIRKGNKSGVTGVFYLVRNDGRASRWIAYITVNGNRKRLGIFKTKEEAIKARTSAALEVYGEFARAK